MIFQFLTFYVPFANRAGKVLAPFAGYTIATEGSNWIIKCAREKSSESLSGFWYGGDLMTCTGKVYWKCANYSKATILSKSC
jgi:hypothetical protein